MEHKNDEIQQSTFVKNIQENVEIVHKILGESADLVEREFIFHEKNDLKIVCFYIDGLVNTQEVDKVLDSLQFKAPELMKNRIEKLEKKDVIHQIKIHFITNPSISTMNEVEKTISEILVGNTAFFIDGSEEVMILSSRGWDTRSVEEPNIEQVVKGPRDGFTENIRTNTALVRRRIADPLFRLESMKIGKKSKTDINIAYLKGTVKEDLLKEVKSRLQKIKIDAILESGYIEELIEDAPYSPFPTVQSTERPDKVAAAILEGRVAIFVDNTPFVLMVPAYFWQYLQASDDYYSRYYAATFYRMIRFIAFFISLTLPSLYVMLASFHQEMIPTALALTIASGREIVPYPVLFEALIMETAFELIREAGLRMPKPVGQAVSIVGSLIIGQAAVQAGLVSPFMVIVVALTGISSFAIPNYSASFSVRLIRFPLLIASGTLGILGFASCLFLLAIHAISLRSFGEPYLAPATPFQPSDQKDALLRLPWWQMNSQPELAEGQETREGQNQMPQPPKIKPGRKNEKEDSKSESSSHKMTTSQNARETSEKTERKRKFRKPKKLKGEKGE